MGFFKNISPSSIVINIPALKLKISQLFSVADQTSIVVSENRNKIKLTMSHSDFIVLEELPFMAWSICSSINQFNNLIMCMAALSISFKLNVKKIYLLQACLSVG